MALAIEFEAGVEAQITWTRIKRLLAVYYASGWEGFFHQRSDLGVRVDGAEGDPLAIVRLVISCEQAMASLRRCNVMAYNLAMGDIEEPARPWFNGRGTGKGDLMQQFGLLRDAQEARELFERAKECLHAQLEVELACTGCPFGR